MDKITNYLITECNQKESVANSLVLPFGKHDDIRIELEQWIDTKEYPNDNCLAIEGCTAKMIFELAPFLNGVGVYNFMVTLRERPDNAKRIISEGFKRK
jgi:hypothetical protein